MKMYFYLSAKKKISYDISVCVCVCVCVLTKGSGAWARRKRHLHRVQGEAGDPVHPPPPSLPPHYPASLATSWGISGMHSWGLAEATKPARQLHL